MATNIFGTPVTTASLRRMPEYSGQLRITNEDRAIVAMEQKNEDGKDVRAREFAEKYQKPLGLDGTMCLIYNATGQSIKLSARKEFNGNLAVPFPILIQNGQYGVFVHTKVGSPMSIGAVAYDGFGADGRTKVQYVLAWRNINNELGQVFNEIRPAGYFTPTTNDATWNVLLDSVNANKTVIHEARGNTSVAYSSMNSTTHTRVMEAIVSIEGVL